MEGELHLEDFWGVELSSKKKKYVWADEESDEDDLDTNRTLELRQACLGAKAKEGERNVVQLTTENEEGDEVTHTILSLGVGKLEQSQLLLTLRMPVTLELVMGQGPVHIVGSVQDTFSAFDSESEDNESEEEEEEESSNPSPVKAITSKKRPATETLSSGKPNKMAKVSAQQQAAPEEEDSDDDDDKEGMEEGSEEDDEEDSDEEGEEEEEEEEEESEEDMPPPKKLANGKKVGKAGAAQFKTPQPKRSQAKAALSKGSRSAPTTPKDKGTAVPKVALTTEEVKAKLAKQHPNLPKKMEKFGNFVANSFKVKDESTKKELWKFVQQLGKREQ